MMILFLVLLKFIWFISILLLLYSLYHIGIMLIGLIKQKPVTEPAKPSFRFLVLIVARNEAAVIGNLIDSLKQQRYPQDLFDILVVPNNCTDNTALVAAEHGVRVLECQETVRSKGEALAYTIRHLPSDLLFDAYINFDADNIVHPDFLLQMNHALCSGATVAQGFRDAKNPHDTINSGCWAIFYWIGGRLMNHPRGLLRLSCAISGTGVMIRKSVIEKLGGWNTVTLADDFELNIQCILAGEKVSWVPDAITYDEQSLKFNQTWKQRRRWLIGVLQSLTIYLRPLFVRTLRSRKMIDIDFLLYCLYLPIQYFSLIIFSLGVILRMIILNAPLFPLTPLYDWFFPMIAMSITLPILTALIVILKGNKMQWPLLKSVILFPAFVASVIPVSIVSLFVYKGNFQWDEIKHIRSISIDEISNTDRQ